MTENGTPTKATHPPAQPRWDHTCPDCHHEHAPRGDVCGEYLGEGKFCHCPSRVAA
jgi:hypothetical protein